MMPPEEAEQGLICEGIRRILYQYRGQINDEDMDTVLELVDSQGEKILEQEKEIERLKAERDTATFHLNLSVDLMKSKNEEIAKLKRQISGTFEPEDFHNQILQDSDPLGQEFR